ncbi:hypothetical protein L7F22_016931 [Adiantum nelumboides]|nr:hypothetical protein [Adiantum nelumboides]
MAHQLSDQRKQNAMHVHRIDKTEPLKDLQKLHPPPLSSFGGSRTRGEECEPHVYNKFPVIAGANALLATSSGIAADCSLATVGGHSPLKSYAAMAYKPSQQAGFGGVTRYEQSRLPVHNPFPSNMFNSPLFPLMHEHDKGVQGFKAINMRAMLNPEGDCVYENPIYDVGQNGKSNSASQGASSPLKGNLKDTNQNHYVTYEEDAEYPSVIIPVAELENWYLEVNYLSGHIPGELGQLPKLMMLSSFKYTFYVVQDLESLVLSRDLSSNSLSGNIPASLGDLKRLSLFNVSTNFLIGEIPEGGALSKFGSKSWVQSA